MLYDAILERMEGDDRHASTGSQSIDGGADRGFNDRKLGIDLDTNGLEGTLGGVMSTISRRSGNGGFDQIRKLARGFNGLFGSCNYDIR